LKTAGRKAMQVRVLSPPPFSNRSVSIRPSTELAILARFCRCSLLPEGIGSLFNVSTALRSAALWSLPLLAHDLRTCDEDREIENEDTRS